MEIDKQKFKLYKKNGKWWAIIPIGGTTIPIMAYNFEWLMQFLASVFGIK